MEETVWYEVSQSSPLKLLTIRYAGNIVHINALGTHVVMLNSMEHISNLFERKGATYSHRPSFTMAGEIVGFDRVRPFQIIWHFSLLISLYQAFPWLPCNDEWRRQRKLIHPILSPEAVKKYHKVQENATALYLKSLLVNPLDFHKDLRR